MDTSGLAAAVGWYISAACSPQAPEAALRIAMAAAVADGPLTAAERHLLSAVFPDVDLDRGDLTTEWAVAELTAGQPVPAARSAWELHEAAMAIVLAVVAVEGASTFERHLVEQVRRAGLAAVRSNASPMSRCDTLIAPGGHVVVSGSGWVDTSGLGPEEALGRLFERVGWHEFKAVVERFVDHVRLTALHPTGLADPVRHWVLAGSPGTGLTTASEHLAQILASLNIIDEPTITEVALTDLTRTATAAGLLVIHTGTTPAATVKDALEALDLLDATHPVVLTGASQPLGELIMDPTVRSRYFGVVTFPDFEPTELVEIATAHSNEILDWQAQDRLRRWFATNPRRGPLMNASLAVSVAAKGQVPALVRAV